MLGAFVITLAVLHVSNAEHNSGEYFLSRVNRFPNKRLLLAESSFDNTTLYYATCDQPPKQCIVVREINPFTQATETKECNVDLKADDVQLIVAFGRDKAILVTKESLTLKTITVDMSSCETVANEVFQIPSEWKDIQLYREFLDVVVFDSGFELVIKELPQLCNESSKNKYCSFSFDNKGKRVEGPCVWPKIMYNDINIVSPIMTDAFGERYIFVHKNIPGKVFFPVDNLSLIGIQVDRKGGPTFVKLWGPIRVSSDVSIGGHSVGNNYNGACYVLNSTVTCWQNNVDGGLEMSTEFIYNKTEDISSLSIHNLPGGGFVILMVTCPNRICSGVDDHYHFMKIDAQAVNMGHQEINLQKSKCSAKNSDILAKPFVNEQGLYCSGILCHIHQEGEAQLEIRTHCYSDKVFSKYLTLVNS